MSRPEPDLPPVLHRGWLGARIGRGFRRAWQRVKAPIVRARGKRLPSADEMERLRQRLDANKAATAEQGRETQVQQAQRHEASQEDMQSKLLALQAKYSKPDRKDRGTRKRRRGKHV